MFNITPLLGAQSTSPASQYLLEFEGGVKVLIDVGWDEDFDVAKLKSLERHVPTLSIVLLTHATSAHLAAFAHCCKHIPLFTKVPIYATTPVISLGRTLLQDIYASTPLASTVIPQDSLSDSSGTSNTEHPSRLLLQPPTAEEIASYFALINPLKYSQPHQPLPSPFSPPLNGLTITGYRAGHTLGGTIWHILHGMESVVHAVDWNLARENVFDSASWLGASTGGTEVIEQLRKPTALICSSKGVEKPPLQGGHLKRDELLLETLRKVIARGGTILIPTDTSARVLELAYLLDRAWGKDVEPNGQNPLRAAKLYLASRNGGATMRNAGSLLEWMNENVVREFETAAEVAEKETLRQTRSLHRRGDSKQIQGNDRPNIDTAAGEKAEGLFEFKQLRILERRSQINRILGTKTAKVILASDVSLEWGFSKEILQSIASDPANLLIFTQEYTNTDTESLGRTLWQWYQERRDGVAMETISEGQQLEQVHTGGRDLEIKFAQRAPLEGRELLTYQRFLATQRQFQNSLQMNNGTGLETSIDAVDETSSTSSSSSDQSEPGKQGKALNISATLAHASRNRGGVNKEQAGVSALLQQPGVYDYDVRGKKGRETVFPYNAKRRRCDDFGELIRPEDYLRAEERDEMNGQDARNLKTSKEPQLGQKRKWEDITSSDPRRSQAGGATRRKLKGDFREDDSRHLNGDGAPEDDSDDSDPEPEEPPLGPSKLTFQTTSVKAHLKLAYIDFSGLHDQRSLSMLIPLIRPRKIVLVGGSKLETAWLAENCRQTLGSIIQKVEDIFCPAIGETVSASMDTNAWTVKLSEALVKRLRWQNVKGLGVVTLMGRLTATAGPEKSHIENPKSKRLKGAKGEVEEPKLEDIPTDSKELSRLMPTLETLPANMVAATRSVAQPLHVGDLRLADLRKHLQSMGHTADFRGEGTLVIDNLVAVRKSGTGKIEIESGGIRVPGPYQKGSGTSFDSVRQRIYDGLAVIAGG